MAALEDDHSFLFKLTALSCIGGFLFGYDTGVISGALVLIEDDFNLTDVEEELIVGMTLVGALISSCFVGYFSDIYGRKIVIIISSIFFVVGSLVLSVFAINYTALIIGRLIVGFGVGSASMIMPMYVCEASPAHIRGQMVTYINVAITGGQFISACIGGALSGTSNGWKIMLGLAAVPAGIQLLGFYFMPESPRWLIEQSRIGEATKILRQLRGRHDVREEVQDILDTIRAERPDEFPPGLNFEAFMSDMSIENEKSVKDSLILSNVTSGWKQPEPRAPLSVFGKLAQKPVFRALLVGCALQAAQQFGGINTVMYYSASILKIAGFSSNSEAIWLSVVVSFFNFAGSLVGLMIVDRYGRRWLTLTSLSCVCICLLALGFAFYSAEICSSKVNFHMTDSRCSSYDYCFDCTQDVNCGYCSEVVSYPVAVDTTLDASLSSISSYHLAEYQSYGSGCMPTTGEGEDHWTNVTANGVTYSCLSQNDFAKDVCEGSKTYGYIILTCLCLYLAAFSPGMGPMPWTINSEIYPTSVRGVANSITTTVNWGSNLIMSMSFLSVISALSRQGAFWLYAGISLLFLIFLYYYLPETLGVPLENIEQLFTESYWGRAQHSRKLLLSEDVLSDQDGDLKSNLSGGDGGTVSGGGGGGRPIHSGSDGESFYRKLMPSSNLMPSEWHTRQLLDDAEASGSLNKIYNRDDSSLDINAVYSTLMRTNTNTDFAPTIGNNYRNHTTNSNNTQQGSNSTRGANKQSDPYLDSFNSRNFSRFARDSAVGEDNINDRPSEITDGSGDPSLFRRHSYDNFVSSGRKDKVRKHLVTSILNPSSAIQPVEEHSDHSRDSLISV